LYLSATAGSSSGEINLAWTTSPGATSYNVYEGTSSGGESGSPVLTDVSSTTTTVDSLTPGDTYYFTVAAVNATGTSVASNEASAEAPP
jgi:fibronectin type 3 domain-containing protein